MDLLCCHLRSCPSAIAGVTGGSRTYPSGAARRSASACGPEANVDVVIHIAKAELDESDDTTGLMNLFATVDWHTPDGRKWHVSQTPTIWMSDRSPQWAHECPGQLYASRGGPCGSPGSRGAAGGHAADNCVLVEVWRASWGGMGTPMSCGSAAITVEDLLGGAVHSASRWSQGPEQELELMQGEETCGAVTVHASVCQHHTISLGHTHPSLTKEDTSSKCPKSGHLHDKKKTPPLVSTSPTRAHQHGARGRGRHASSGGSSSEDKVSTPTFPRGKAPSDTSMSTTCSKNNNRQASPSSSVDSQTDDDSTPAQRIAAAMMSYGSPARKKTHMVPHFTGPVSGSKSRDLICTAPKQLDPDVSAMLELARRLRTTCKKYPKGGKGWLSWGAKHDRFITVYSEAVDLDLDDEEVFGQGLQNLGLVGNPKRRESRAPRPQSGRHQNDLMLSWWSNEATWRDKEPPLDSIRLEAIVGVIADGQGLPEATDTTVTLTFNDDKGKTAELVVLFAAAMEAHEWANDLKKLVALVERLHS